MWEEEDEEDGNDSEKNVFGEDEPVRKERNPKQDKVKAAQRPTKQKFAEIMKNQDAFPTLENEFQDDEDDEELSEQAEKTAEKVAEIPAAAIEPT